MGTAKTRQMTESTPMMMRMSKSGFEAYAAAPSRPSLPRTQRYTGKNEVMSMPPITSS